MGTNAAIFLPFLISCTRAHLRIAELGCLASMPLGGGGEVGAGGWAQMARGERSGRAAPALR
jgi:hypothetical protein